MDRLTAFEELVEKLLRGVLVPPLHQDVECHAVLIHRPPEIVPLLIDRDAHFVQMPLITRPRTPASELKGIRLAAFPTLLTDRFVGDDDATDEEDLFHITVAQREAEIQPDSVADDLTREPVVFAEIGRG